MTKRRNTRVTPHGCARQIAPSFAHDGVLERLFLVQSLKMVAAKDNKMEIKARVTFAQSLLSKAKPVDFVISVAADGSDTIRDVKEKVSVREIRPNMWFESARCTDIPAMHVLYRGIWFGICAVFF